MSVKITNSSIKQIIKLFIPYGIIEWRRKKSERLNDAARYKQNEIVTYYKNLDRNNQPPEIVEIIDFVLKNPYFIFPYEFTKKYQKENITITVYMDRTCKMNYVLHENKRMYFPKNLTVDQIKTYYRRRLLEQDIDSPHRYETASVHIQEGDIIADIGASEGMISLSNVEKAKKIYLFECDKQWIKSLKKTFEPWKEKVRVVNKYISAATTKKSITLDDFLGGGEINFIKADIEGAEMQLLRGGPGTLAHQKKLQIILCTYHRQNDAEELNQILTENGFITEYSKGYMVFVHDPELKAPYLRRGLIRARK